MQYVLKKNCIALNVKSPSVDFADTLHNDCELLDLPRMPRIFIGYSMRPIKISGGTPCKQ